MRKMTIAMITTMALSVGTPAMAKEQHRQLDAHVHGAGKLNIALEGNKVAMELEVPGMDIVGFEHKPNTDQQKAAIKAAQKILKEDALSLFVLPQGAGCKLVSSKVGVPGHKDIKTNEHGHKHEEHEEKTSHDKHEGERKDEHKDEHKGEHKDDAEHSEFHAKYALECADPLKLTSIRFGFFKQFPRAESLAVVIVTASSQGAHKVTRKNPVIDGLIK